MSPKLKIRKLELEIEDLKSELKKIKETQMEEQNQEFEIDLDLFYSGEFQGQKLQRIQAEKTSILPGFHTMDVPQGFQVLPFLT